MQKRSMKRSAVLILGFSIVILTGRQQVAAQERNTPAIRILMPQQLLLLETTMRMAGFGLRSMRLS